MKKVTVKKIWNNRVSVKGTDLEAGLKKGGLIIVFEGLQIQNLLNQNLIIHSLTTCMTFNGFQKKKQKN